MLLGVLLHALIPYLSFKIPGLLWAVHDPAADNAFVDITYWIIHGFRVPLFFMLGGYFAFYALRSRTALGFVKGRLRRLGVPLLAGFFTIVFPLMYLVWGWGWIRSDLIVLRQLIRFRYEPDVRHHLYGYAHLWFLVYLILYCTLLACVIWCYRRWSGRREEVDSRGRLCQRHESVAMKSTPGLLRIWGSWLAVSTTLAFGGLVVYFDPRCITSFHNWFLPRSSEFFYHGSFFTVGALLAASPWIQGAFARCWWLVLGVGIAAGYAFVQAVQQPGTLEHSLALSVSSPLYAGLTSIGLIHLCLSVIHQTDKVSTYLSDRSFWIYVTHPPFVGIAQVLLYKVQMPVWGKIAIGFVFATVCCILLYVAWEKVKASRAAKVSQGHKAAMSTPSQSDELHAAN